MSLRVIYHDKNADNRRCGQQNGLLEPKLASVELWVLMALRKVAVVLHLSSSREQDTGDLESQALHRQGLGHEMKGCCGARSGRTQVVVLRHFSHWPCRNCWWGPQGLRMVRPLVKLAEVRGAELDRKGDK